MWRFLKEADVCRKHGISQPTYSNSNSKYGGRGVSELKRRYLLDADLFCSLTEVYETVHQWMID